MDTHMPRPMNVDSIIRNVTGVIKLNQDEIDYFTSILEPKIFRKKDFVLRAGEVCHYETYVVRGVLKIFYIDPAGTEHIVKFAIEDWWALDLQSFMMQTPAFYFIQVMEEAETLRISRTNHQLLYQRIPGFEKFGRVMFQQAYILLQNRMTQQLFASAEERYHHFKEKYPGLDTRIPQKEIAAYLGITPEFLSMLRRKRMKRSIS